MRTTTFESWYVTDTKWKTYNRNTYCQRDPLVGVVVLNNGVAERAPFAEVRHNVPFFAAHISYRAENAGRNNLLTKFAHVGGANDGVVVALSVTALEASAQVIAVSVSFTEDLTPGAYQLAVDLVNTDLSGFSSVLTRTTLGVTVILAPVTASSSSTSSVSTTSTSFTTTTETKPPCPAKSADYFGGISAMRAQTKKKNFKKEDGVRVKVLYNGVTKDWCIEKCLKYPTCYAIA